MMPESRENLGRSDRYFVNWYEADISGQAKVSAICNYLQESAWRHANAHGFGFEEASKMNQAWVIVALRLEIEKYPRWGEHVRVETWPRDVRGLFAYRDYRIFNNNDEMTGAASSSWMVIDTQTRRPQRLEILKDARHIEPGKKALTREPELLRSHQALQEIGSHQAEYSEIDFHGHVNNTRYVDWCMNTFPLEHHQQHEVAEMTINYLLEVRYKENISILANVGRSPVSFMEGRRSTDGKSVLRMEVDWRNR